MDEATAGLSSRDFNRLAQLIEGQTGIKMPPNKKTMVEGRLRRRVRALGLADLRGYCRYVLDEGGLDGELVHLIDVVTTNKTDFCREPRHFDFLGNRTVTVLAEESGAGLRRPLTAWSAACSTGQEPYTIAMVLAEVARSCPDFDYRVYATDISTQVLQTARRAVYAEELAEPIPPEMRRRYLMRSINRATATVRIVPELRNKVTFAHYNLLSGHYPWAEPMDVIFCRNVLIYFDRPTQQQVLSFLCRNLRPGGFLFLGHSETLSGLTLPVRQAAPSVYRRS